VAGPNFTELWISIDPEADYRATLHKIQESMQGYPKERSKEVLSGRARRLSASVRHFRR
jgi:hypothetical protein